MRSCLIIRCSKTMRVLDIEFAAGRRSHGFGGKSKNGFAALSHQNLAHKRLVADYPENLTRERNRQIRETYDQVFSDESIKKEQLNCTQWFEGLEIEEGQEW